MCGYGQIGGQERGGGGRGGTAEGEAPRPWIKEEESFRNILSIRNMI